MHVVPGLNVLYFGTPVVLISTLNLDGTANLAPMSSAWWLGQTAVLGLDATSQTTVNLRRERECVLSLPSALIGTRTVPPVTICSSPVRVLRAPSHNGRNR